MTNSRIPGFYKLSLDQKLDALAKAAGMDLDLLTPLLTSGLLTTQEADLMVENVVATHNLPLGIGLNFTINGIDRLIPMVIEEPSVVAGASFMAKLARTGGGFHATSSAPEMIGQIQILDVDDIPAAIMAIEGERGSLLAQADQIDPILKELGGGARDLEIRVIEDSPIGAFLVLHLIYDVRDAMGANAVNTACEKLAPRLEELTGGRVHLRILSNLSDRRLAKVKCTIPVDELAFETSPHPNLLPRGEGTSPLSPRERAEGEGIRNYTGEEVRDGIIEAWAFAAVDPYRAATHNKGIMNGVDAVVIATGNDWRAIEAGAHAFAARDGKYTSLSTWGQDGDGNLVGTLEMPMAVGIVGGATRVHPTAQIALKLMKVNTASELAEIIVAVGLAQNLAALRALATEGIQRGHMSLHARQVAIAAGASGELVEQVAAQMVAEKMVRIDRAEEILKKKKPIIR
ncbi:MAG: hydroxymethylglutaryl-CoA reductase [Anaerolineales bacterium]|uniref:Hydroxymethylglutaryl-CoA reductase n=1 Tax=Candidatus Desulfolinea nitratireducens TaxID=2841698 RepID=A0A8J6TDH2_9CHLR|nr:hydroxymethylglutaryl-CoA reductase [Candidatus Desulfolinea nitratireducens]MBL6959999.1 hydroxymethylglutaryl-CoA reductase [Anaerolineales bacterium]